MFAPRLVYREIRPYDVEPEPSAVALADNTSPFGVPPAALQAVRDATDERLAQYPSTYSAELREAFASYVGVQPDEVMVGAGSNEVMSCSFRALADPGATLAYMDPTFVMTRPFAMTNSLTPVAVPLGPDYDADAEALIEVRAALTYLCTPNNPTGLSIAPAILRRVVSDAAGIVLVDEAYAEYAQTNLASEAPAHGRMLVLRTMSKAFGMAGFRVGFGVGSRTLVRELEKARGPYAVSALSERAATTALREDVPWVRRGAELVRGYRDQFAASLRAAGFDVLPSAGNFVLLRVGDAEASAQTLRSHGILVRHFANLVGVGPALRISIGTERVMQRVLTALREGVPCG